MTGFRGRVPVARGHSFDRSGPRIRRGVPTPCGTQRRLQALMARGWSIPAIVWATGMRPLQLDRALENGGSITPKLAAAVSTAYDRLWDQPPPFVMEDGRELAGASARVTRQRGWAPPLAWDDDQIDKPDGRPAEGWRPGARKTRRSAELAEDAEFVRSAGGYREASLRAIADRLGVSHDQLEKAVSRQRAAEADRHQLELG